MSHYLNNSGKTILQFSIPTAKLEQILANLNYPTIETIRDASFEQKRIILLVSFREFLKGNFLLEEFSEIASELKMVFPQANRSQEQEEYELMIFEAADLSLYARIHDTAATSRLAGFLETLWNYFTKYKYLLNQIPSRYSSPSVLEKY